MAHKTADCNEATETKIVVMVNRGGMERGGEEKKIKRENGTQKRGWKEQKTEGRWQ